MRFTTTIKLFGVPRMKVAFIDHFEALRCKRLGKLGYDPCLYRSHSHHTLLATMDHGR